MWLVGFGGIRQQFGKLHKLLISPSRESGKLARGIGWSTALRRGSFMMATTTSTGLRRAGSVSSTIIWINRYPLPFDKCLFFRGRPRFSWLKLTFTRLRCARYMSNNSMALANFGDIS